MRRRIWQTPELRREGDLDVERRVTWLELFFDLFFVAVIARLSHDLVGQPTIRGLRDFVFLFIPVWWVWIGITYYNERFETAGLENRLFTFALMVPVAGLAVYAHEGLQENFTAFALSYAGARAVITLRWLEATCRVPEARAAGVRVVIGFGTGIVLAAVAAHSGPDRGLPLFALALVVELVTPLTTISAQASLPRLSISKYPERFGLFVIIVLGETVVAVATGLVERGNQATPASLEAILALAIGFALWWVYFDFIARRPFKHFPWAMAWAYLHLPLVMGVVAVGAGLLLVLESGALVPGSRGLVSGGVASSLVSMGLLEFTLQRQPNEPTHPLLSPGLKLATAAVSVTLVWERQIGAVQLLGVTFSLLAINIAYGVWVWFRDPQGDTGAGDGRKGSDR